MLKMMWKRISPSIPFSMPNEGKKNIPEKEMPTEDWLHAASNISDRSIPKRLKMRKENYGCIFRISFHEAGNEISPNYLFIVSFVWLDFQIDQRASIYAANQRRSVQFNWVVLCCAELCAVENLMSYFFWLFIVVFRFMVAVGSFNILPFGFNNTHSIDNPNLEIRKANIMPMGLYTVCVLEYSTHTKTYSERWKKKESESENVCRGHAQCPSSRSHTLFQSITMTAKHDKWT